MTKLQRPYVEHGQAPCLDNSPATTHATAP